MVSNSENHFISKFSLIFQIVCRSLSQRGPAVMLGPSHISSPSSSSSAAAMAARLGLPRAETNWPDSSTEEEEQTTGATGPRELDPAASTINLFPDPAIVGRVRQRQNI